ncbi:hypothetical protein F4678DRAFT_418282 [Xylaria arbuscula]|nr:hypothetical protein F4678DRAFT_418282 [Xylaria arbuscula]
MPNTKTYEYSITLTCVCCVVGGRGVQILRAEITTMNSNLVPTRTPTLLISCHCGAAKQTVRLCAQSSDAPQEVSLCHCSACRHNTGLLCVSYVDIEPPGSLEGLVEYRSSGAEVTRFFCATCGCHVFRRFESLAEDDTSTRASDGIVTGTAEKQGSWAVATGVITGLQKEDEELDERGTEMLMRYARHINTAGTKDGGLGLFIELGVDDRTHLPLSSTGCEKGTAGGSDTNVEVKTFSGYNNSEGKEEEILNAFCHCKAVQFHITRPNETSKIPRSNFPDLMVPYHTRSPQVQNPEDKKWWLRPHLNSTHGETEPLTTEKDGLQRYLAGTCACASCRLTSGFEIQTWAFIPRANIFFHIRDDSTSSSAAELHATNTTQRVVPVDFATLPPGILTSYESSQGVRREFCSSCGATVFWRDRWRPELMDVSVGLLDADEGARAETWLDWWTGRVSFAEDAVTGRTGVMARTAKLLIDSLGAGLDRWGKQEETPKR